MMNDNTANLTMRQRWLLAIRPKTLTAAVAPVLLGWGVAASATVAVSGATRFHWGAALAALFGSIMIQIATNLVNDVVDYAKGTDTEDRLGPTRVTQTGLLTTRQVWGGVFVSFGLAALSGVYLTVVAGWPVLVIGVASILAGIAYTAGPYPLAYIGWGDVFVMIFFGFVAVGGTVFVITGALPAKAWWAAAAAGALTVNILVVNNIRDIDTDRQAGRTNIPVRFGRQAAEWEYALMLLVAYAAPVVLVLRDLASPFALLAFLTLPQGIKLLQILRGGLAGPPLNPVLGQTAQLLLRFCVLLGLGLAVPALVGLF